MYRRQKLCRRSVSLSLSDFHLHFPFFWFWMVIPLGLLTANIYSLTDSRLISQWGVTLGRGVPPVSQILTPFLDQECHFHTPFQTCSPKYISVFQPGGLTNATYVSLGKILSSYQEPISLKSISKSHLTLTLFLIHLELKRQIRSCTPVVPWKTMPVIPDQNRQSLYKVPVFRSNGPKIIPFFIPWRISIFFGTLRYSVPQET